MPVFKDKKDSVDYASASAALQAIMNGPIGDRTYGEKKRNEVDSLMNTTRRLWNKAIGFMDIYKSRTGFTLISDLMNERIEPEKVMRLSIDQEGLRNIPDKVYACRNLAELELINTSIALLPAKLNDLKKLKTIYIYNNKPVSRLKLSRNDFVRQMTIRGSYADKVPVKFKKFRRLDTLDLSKNIGLDRFPSISRNKHLSKLVMTDNKLTLADLRKGNKHLIDLSLPKNRIEIVPRTISKFPNLRNLQLSHNEIHSVSPEIGKLTNLENLAFYQNKLTHIPPAVFSLKNLKEIDFYFNRLDEVNPEIGNLTELRILYLSNNFLRTLPESIGNLTSLTELYAHHNELDSLPASLKNLTHLKRIGLNDNNLEWLPSYFVGFKELEEIDLSENQIKVLPLGWTDLSSLKIFGIKGNPFRNEEEIRKELKALEAKGTISHYQSR